MFVFTGYYTDIDETEVVATIKVSSGSLITTLKITGESGMPQDVEFSCKELEKHYPGISKHVFNCILEELQRNGAFQYVVNDSVKDYVENYNPIKLMKAQ